VSADRPSVPEPEPAAVPDVDVLVVDNYDSFAYNLVQYVGELAGSVTVRRNDAVDLEGIDALDPDGVIVSPGPGHPEEAGVSMPLFEQRRYPTLGVCLGHQALCAANGADVGHAPDVVHGKPSVLEHDGEGRYATLPDQLRGGRTVGAPRYPGRDRPDDRRRALRADGCPAPRDATHRGAVPP